MNAWEIIISKQNGIPHTAALGNFVPIATAGCARVGIGAFVQSSYRRRFASEYPSSPAACNRVQLDHRNVGLAPSPTLRFRSSWAGRIGQHLAGLDKCIDLQHPATDRSCEHVQPSDHPRANFPRRGAPGFGHDDPNAGDFLFQQLQGIAGPATGHGHCRYRCRVIRMFSAVAGQFSPLKSFL